MSAEREILALWWPRCKRATRHVDAKRLLWGGEGQSGLSRAGVLFAMPANVHIRQTLQKTDTSRSGIQTVV